MTKKSAVEPKNTAFHALEPDACLALLESGKGGLSEAVVGQRREEFGENVLKAQNKRGPWRIFFEQWKDFLILLLVGAALLSFALGEMLDASAMLSIVLLSAMLGFFQEYRAEQAVEALNAMTAPLAMVIRGGQTQEVEASALVPGDVMLVEAGDIAPADGRILLAEQLMVDEACLTGESLSVEKNRDPVSEESPVSEQWGMLFMGTSIVHGNARAVVTTTGMSTEMGKIAQSLQETQELKTPLQLKFERVTKQIGLAVLAIVALVFVVSLLQKPESLSLQQYAFKMLLFSLSLAVAAVPSSLPAIVTIGLSMGTRALADKNMIIKHLPTAESLGSLTVICSDKTGTLTKNEMTLRRCYLPSLLENVEVTGTGYELEGEVLLGGKPVEVGVVESLFRAAVLCNNATLSPEGEKDGVLGDPTEGALLVAARKVFDEGHFESFERVQEFPFDSERKMMSVICRDGEGKRWSLVKGGVDVLVARCSSVLGESGVRKLEERDVELIEAANEGFASDALRVLAFAMREVSDSQEDSEGKISQEDAEGGLVFLGLVGMLDPPREGVKEAIEKARRAGIQVMMITGDHALTARAVAREVGLLSEGGLVLTGGELGGYSDEELVACVGELQVMARALPEHKLRIVEALQRKGEIVAMTGDGVNDAPALKRAEVGLAMGVTGTEVAKEVANAIIVDDNFSTIVNAIEEGRNIYDKILKSTRYLLSCNMGEVLLVFFSVAAGVPLPLLPLQILLMNLVTDGLPALALGLEASNSGTMERPPRSPDENPLDRSALLRLLLFGVVMGAGTLVLFWWFLPQGITKARSVAFTAAVMFEMFAVFSARSLVAWRQLNPLRNPWLILAVLSSIGLHLAILYVPALQAVFKTTGLSGMDWLLILAVSSLGFFVMELTKTFIKDTRPPRR